MKKEKSENPIIILFLLLLMVLLSVGPTYGKSDKFDSMSCNLFYPGRVSLMFRSNGVDSYLYYIGDLRNPMSYEFVYKLNAEETKILSDYLYDMIITKDGKPFTVISEVPWNAKIHKNEKETGLSASMELSDKCRSLRVSGYYWSDLDSINRYYDEYIKYSENLKNMIRYFDKLAFKAMNQGVLYKGIKFYYNQDSLKVVHSYTIDFGEKFIKYSHNKGKLFKKDSFDCKPKYLKSSESGKLNEYIEKFYINNTKIKINQDKEFALNDNVRLAVKITFKGSPVSDMNHYIIDENTDVNKTIYTGEFVEFIDYIKYLFSKYQ